VGDIMERSLQATVQSPDPEELKKEAKKLFNFETSEICRDMIVSELIKQEIRRRYERSAVRILEWKKNMQKRDLTPAH
jgi:hypothetical protein